MDSSTMDSSTMDSSTMDSSTMDSSKSHKRNRKKYVASMVLSGVGDAIGYNNGVWEFNNNGAAIHSDVAKLGGIVNLDVGKLNMIVSDDTVMHIATAEGLIEGGDNELKMIANKYVDCVQHDMKKRSPGIQTERSIYSLANQPIETLSPEQLMAKYNPTGGGCGAAMRTMVIGLRYHNDLNKLIKISVESSRITHNHPTGFLGGFASAYFIALAINKIDIRLWPLKLLKVLPKVLKYLRKSNGKMADIYIKNDSLRYFIEEWIKYIKFRGLLIKNSSPVFPKKYGVKERDEFYSKLSYSGKGGSSGHDSVMIAYDAILYAEQFSNQIRDRSRWNIIVEHAILHGGDNDSTGAIAGALYGALYGMSGVYKKNYDGLEYKNRLISIGKKIYAMQLD